ncbi:hypothetical protein [Aeribacillus alveayuensis]|uniref:Sterol carrier protein n=1 Tax=Aeribacillus alveayuensis TaxID=279215 RepID=A0ABT9VM52_9BACI|nr:putative sterol carrier protein [Bacillus alveayuensis]
MLELLTNKVNSCDLIKPLLPKEPIFISFQGSEGKCCHYVLNFKGLQPLKEIPEILHVKIVGNSEQLQELIKGELRLQQLMKLNALKVEGKFRDILKIEAMISLSVSSENSLTSDNI